MTRRNGLAATGCPSAFARIGALLLVMSWLAVSDKVAAAEDADASADVRRLVIGLFDSRGLEDQPDTELPIASMLEMPLNHLGMVVRSHDIRSGPPPEAWLPQARAVVTWLRPAGDLPAWLWPWLEQQVPANRLRVVHFQYPGGLTAQPHRERLQRWLAPFGLVWEDGFVGNPRRVQVDLLSSALCCVEDDPRRHASHQGPRSTSKTNRVWVRTRDRAQPEDVRTPVVTGPWGGLALEPWTIREGDEPGTRRWRLDPFAFFREALGLQRIPAPHPSVINGRRMLVFHVDGDGFESLSRVRPGQYAARVFLDEIIDVYRVPTTASIIVASLTRDLESDGMRDRMAVAREILNREHVEAASHGVLHPYRWAAPWAPGRPPLDTLPYKGIANYDYSPAAEVRESTRFINERLLRDGKRCRVMLWTGDCLPPREAILECARVGCANLNGGSFRWDAANDSLGYVSPWVRWRGDAVQVTVGATNENEYPGYFRTNPGGFAHVNTTIERTGQGRILKPANVYVHYYSAETAARLRTLKRILDRWVHKEPTAPVFASTYTAAVEGALNARIRKTAAGWSLREFGACRTVRFDDEPLEVDFARCRGVLGARRIDDALYVHLTAGEAEIVLAAEPAAHPHVEEANHTLEDATLASTSVAVSSQATFQRSLVFAGLPRDAQVRVRIGKASESRRTDAEGRLPVTLPAGGPDAIEVRIP